MLPHILHERVPAWYEVGLAEGCKAIIVRLHRQTAAYVKRRLTRSSPFVLGLTKELKIPEFLPPTEEAWGFGMVLVPALEERDDWMAWQCPLPVWTKEHWTSAYAVSATLNVLFTCAYSLEEPTVSPMPQLLQLSFCTFRDMHGGSLNVEVAAALSAWIATQPDNSRNEKIEEAMKRAYQQTYRSRMSELDTHRFRAWFRQPHWVNLTVPGNACGLDPKDYDACPGHGYTLLPHNVDSPFQQLTLLAGIAAMHDLARKDGF